jgi:hypothetical protein
MSVIDKLAFAALQCEAVSPSRPRSASIVAEKTFTPLKGVIRLDARELRRQRRRDLPPSTCPRRNDKPTTAATDRIKVLTRQGITQRQVSLFWLV